MEFVIHPFQENVISVRALLLEYVSIVINNEQASANIELRAKTIGYYVRRHEFAKILISGSWLTTLHRVLVSYHNFNILYLYVGYHNSNISG